MHCIVGPHIFTLYLMFHLNVHDISLHDKTDVGRNTGFHKAI